MPYKVVKIDDKRYLYMLIATSYLSPLRSLSKIEEDFRREKCPECKILFDMLLSLGNTAERFIEARFDGERVDATSWCFISIDKTDGLREVLPYQVEDFSNSVLNSYQVNMLKKGIII